MTLIMDLKNKKIMGVHKAKDFQNGTVKKEIMELLDMLNDFEEN